MTILDSLVIYYNIKQVLYPVFQQMGYLDDLFSIHAVCFSWDRVNIACHASLKTRNLSKPLVRHPVFNQDYLQDSVAVDLRQISLLHQLLAAWEHGHLVLTVYSI